MSSLRRSRGSAASADGASFDGARSRGWGRGRTGGAMGVVAEAEAIVAAATIETAPGAAAIEGAVEPTPAPAVEPRLVAGEQLAVTIHDIEPTTFERCALIRDWLEDFGIDRVTLLVIPAPDLHPFSDRRPEMVEWLGERAAAGDEIAQHGFTHGSRTGIPGRGHHEPDEFSRLDEAETRRCVESGRRILRLAGVLPRGFVAPGFAYPPALRTVLAERFDWWASSQAVRHEAGRRSTRSPATGFGLGRRHALGTAGPGRLLRLELHPRDFDDTDHVLDLERAFRRARHRTPVTYADLR